MAGFWWAAFLHGEKAALCGLGLESLLRLLALLTAAVILCLGQELGASLLHWSCPLGPSWLRIVRSYMAQEATFMVPSGQPRPSISVFL